MSEEAGGSNAGEDGLIKHEPKAEDEPETQTDLILESGVHELEDADVDGVIEAAHPVNDEDDYFGQFEGQPADAVSRKTEDAGSRAADQLADEDIPQFRGDANSEDKLSIPSTPTKQTTQLQSPADTSSIPDDGPSIPSSPDPTASPLPRKHVLRTGSGALQPFERRFETRRSSSQLLVSPRASSPAFLSAGSRQISLSSQISSGSSPAGTDADEPIQAPWDVVRWTRLKKLTGQAFSEVGRRNFGRPTCLAVSALIAVGTTKGFVLGFDYHQTLKIIMGPSTKAAECGSVTALAVSADYSTICAGHASGHIFTWEVNRPARPFLHIPPIERSVLRSSQHADGHIAGLAVSHIGFLGTRHTALVSADAGGMAFSHLASRGLGPVTRTVTTTRLLGRYPHLDPQIEKARKPSSVLAFAPLPLGNVEQATDSMGLTAMLTPYLLVIVSTTPTAHTQHKAVRPKDVSPHSTLSGCIAWFPAVKRKSNGKDIADAKLVYCWSNVISILEVKILANTQDPERTPNLEFTTRSRWRAEEPIVAVQWLGRSVLGALTISQRLLIIDDSTLQVTDSLDLLQRRIYHQDLFSKQLHAVVEQLDHEDVSMHGVVADAFYMSFRAYKGRLFILSFNDLAVGTLSNWADRLVALMEAGDHIAAIRLSTEYYAGNANITIGLPENETLRHEMVKERLIAMITASLQYSFAQQSDDRTSHLRELADVAFEACIVMEEKAFLLNEVFEHYLDDDQDALFVQALEPYILDEEIQSIPPILVKSLVSYYISQQQSARLEDLLCRLEPQSFDLDQVTTLCKQHNLYDALVFVWTQALEDFVTPLIDLLSLVKVAEPDENDPFSTSAMKVFPYLAFTFTGRDYPSGQYQEDDSRATNAKSALYNFLFSGRPLTWPPGTKQVVHTVDEAEDEPAYPYLTLLLQFDTPSFMSMMNEAFEDAYLNKNEDDMTNGTAATNGSTKLKMTRQHLIDIMLTTMKQDMFDEEERIFLDMFIARNLPKYSTELVFTGSLLDAIFQHLCHPPTDELHDDCQLSIEYLLSVYQPPDTTTLLEHLREAKFYRVMKTIYRRQKLFPELFELYFDDPEDKEGVFDFVLSSVKIANQKQIATIKSRVVIHSDDLVAIDTVQTAQMIARFDVELLESVISELTDSLRTLLLLRTFFQPGYEKDVLSNTLPEEQQTILEERYVRLMCIHDPARVADYLGQGQSGDLRLAELLPAMEEHGVVDAEVMLLRKHGLYADAMKRLVKHMHSLRQTMTSLFEAVPKSPDIAGTMEAASDLMQEVEKYTKIGLWLSQNFDESQLVKPVQSLLSISDEESLSLNELLWLNLVDAVVSVTQAISEAIYDARQEMDEFVDDIEHLQHSLRINVQQTFTVLLVASSSTGNSSTQHLGTLSKDSFLRILRAFLQRAAASAQSLSDLRDVLADIFAAYAFEQDVLTMANDLLGADVFTDIQKAYELRQRGWRPRGSACEICKRKAWGPGIGESVWEEYMKRELDLEDKKIVRWKNAESGKRQERGKGKAGQHVVESSTKQDVDDDERKRLTLVLFSCRHVFHRACLEEKRIERDDGKFECPICAEQK